MPIRRIGMQNTRLLATQNTITFKAAKARHLAEHLGSFSGHKSHAARHTVHPCMSEGDAEETFTFSDWQFDNTGILKW